MSYQGAAIPIPLGIGGLHTDDAGSLIPATDYIVANNVSLSQNQVEKVEGSRKYNSSALSAEVVGLYDWFPTSLLQRLIAVTADGMIYRDIGDRTFSSNVAINSSLGTLSPNIQMVEGGNEVTGNSKKLFLFTGNRQVKVLTGDGVTFNDITTPAADWTTSYPTFGLLHKGRLWAFGNSNSPHRTYASDPTNHETFTGVNLLTFDVFPGEGAGLSSGFVFKGRLFLFKSPSGVYFLDDDDNDTDNWSFKKLSETFGVASPHSILQAINDGLVGNSSGSITSMAAVQAFGDIETADTLSIMRVEDFIRNNTSPAGYSLMQASYYEEKKIAFFTYRSTVNNANDRILLIDFNQQQRPRAVFLTCFQPSCVAIRKDPLGVRKPIYGDKDGYVYLMDQEDRDVAGAGYTSEIQTPYIDFGQVDQTLAGKNKNFDFLELVYEAQGKWNLSVDVFIDGKFMETVQFQQTLGTNTLGTFVLGTNKLSRQHPESRRKPLHGSGRRISLRCYNGTVGQNFKLHQAIISFRPSDEKQIAH